MKLSKVIKRITIDRPKHFRLTDFDPAETHGIDIDKKKAEARLADDIARLRVRSRARVASSSRPPRGAARA